MILFNIETMNHGKTFKSQKTKIMKPLAEWTKNYRNIKVGKILMQNFKNIKSWKVEKKNLNSECIYAEKAKTLNLHNYKTL